MLKHFNTSHLPVEKLSRLFSAISIQGEARLVGGCVRDTLLGRYDITDYDIATSVLPQELLKILNASNIKANILNLNHGAIVADIDNLKCEITTLRKDVACNGRHAEVLFVSDWEVDAERRDFTVNAMFMDLNGQVYDYFSGIDDLKNGIIRFVGDPILRIKEDYLRILRYFRFCARFGITHIDENSFFAAKNLAHELSAISGERIKSECFKTLTAEYSKDVMQMIYDHKINHAILLPDINHESLDSLRFSSYPLVNLAALLLISNGSKMDIIEIAKRWRFSQYESKMLLSLYEKYILYQDILLESTKKTHRKLLYILGLELYQKVLLLVSVMNPHLHYEEMIKILANEEILDFPIDGYDLKNIGLRGKTIGEAMEFLKLAWIESDFQYSKQELLEKYTASHSLK